MNFINKAINGVEDALTPQSVKQQRTFVRPPSVSTTTPKFTRPKTQKQITIGQNNATDSSKQPKGTTFGSPYSKALTNKVK